MHINIRKWPFVQLRDEPAALNLGWIALGVMVLSSSTYNAFAKILTGVLSPITLVFMSEMLTGFFVLLSFGTVPTFRAFLSLEKKSYIPLLLIGMLNGVLAPLLLFVGLSKTTAINGALFGNAEMVFLTLLAVVVLRESFHRAHALSILTILGGIIIIALRGFTDGIELSVGDFIVVVSCFCYATGGIVFRKFLPHADPNIVILTRSMVGMTAFFLLSPFVSHPLVAEIAAFPLQVLPVLLGFAFISRFLNLFSFYEAMERLPVTTVSLCLNLPVIGSIVFSAWFLGESIELYHLIGGAFIIAGALMLEMAGMHPSEQHLDKHLRHGNMRSPT